MKTYLIFILLIFFSVSSYSKQLEHSVLMAVPIDSIDRDLSVVTADSELSLVLDGSAPLLADTDGDGVNDNIDAFPTDASESVDTDSDGIGNNADIDDDNDGFAKTGSGRTQGNKTQQKVAFVSHTAR